MTSNMSKRHDRTPPDNKSGVAATTGELRRLRKRLVGDHYDRYEKKFDKMRQSSLPVSFHLPAFLLSYFWAFYRGLYVMGFVAMLSVLGGFYLVLSQNAHSVTPPVVLGNILMAAPALFFGFFGIFFYQRFIDRTIQVGLSLPKSKQESYFGECAGGNLRLSLGMIFATVFVCATFVISLSGRS